MGGGAFGVEHLLTEVNGTGLQYVGKAFAILYGKLGLQVIAGGAPGVGSIAFKGVVAGDGVGIAPGPAHLTGLFRPAA